jgi:hypothetical protein
MELGLHTDTIEDALRYIETGIKDALTYGDTENEYGVSFVVGYYKDGKIMWDFKKKVPYPSPNLRKMHSEEEVKSAYGEYLVEISKNIPEEKGSYYLGDISWAAAYVTGTGEVDLRVFGNQMQNADIYGEDALDNGVVEVKSELCLAVALRNIQKKRLLTLWKGFHKSIIFDTEKNTVAVCIHLC